MVDFIAFPVLCWDIIDEPIVTQLYYNHRFLESITKPNNECLIQW